MKLTELIKKHPNLPVMHCAPISNTSMMFSCPWCKGVHYHGRGSGTRASHCPDYQGEYIVADPSSEREE